MGKTIIGTLVSAGIDREFFTLHIKGAQEKYQKVFDKKFWPECEALVGKRVEVVVVTNEKNPKFTDFVSIREAPTGPAAGPATGSPQQYDDNIIGRQKARCSLFQSACNLVGLIFPKDGTYTTEGLSEQVVAIARAGEKYVYEQTLLEIAKSLGAVEVSLEDEFNELVGRLTADPKSPAGKGFISQWLKKNGYKVETFGELSPVDQDAACATMRLLFAPQK